MVEFGVSAPWQASIQVRLRYYESVVDEPAQLLTVVHDLLSEVMIY
jgi:hypothetical protein